MRGLDLYLQDVCSQLTCNRLPNSEYYSYNYTEEDVYENLDYFENCLKIGLSAYKALLYFGDYLKGDYEM